MAKLVPAIGCVVVYGKRVGFIASTKTIEASSQVKVNWQDNGKTTYTPLDLLSSGYANRLGMEVQHNPESHLQPSFGIGIVQKTRVLGTYEQVLVDFPEAGIKQWLPFERLSFVKGTRHRYVTGETDSDPERFRMKFLAHSIENWHENTGALSHLDIDPLPHQIHLVHHILNHGSRNWLIADDVGLGKTIEAGMLIKALEQRGLADRILLVTPAGLTQQWNEALKEKFKLNNFLIYGDRFTIEEAREWAMYKNVIASIDRLKEPEHIELLLQADNWDLIIFDEAHRLSRTLYGNKYAASQRFNLAKELRKKTDAMIFLTATPHQGKEDKFQALLEVLRPDLKKEINTLSLNPEVLREIMIRNNKADVTDAEGNFIFRGKKTHAITVEVDEATLEFDAALQEYLKLGYAEAHRLGITGNAIGFVMTVYRKLAASSVQAIYRALVRRHERLSGQLESVSRQRNQSEDDERFEGEQEELFDTEEAEFFTGEIKMLGELINQCAELIPGDLKLKQFIESIIRIILKNNPDEKVLVFTEYRATQDYIKQALEERFGDDRVDLINGSMNINQRTEAIKHFEGKGQFLVSTEAGGEGINLQQYCHIMVNYDLPWNPMRLVQRVGRLYRYGQEKVVVVFNLHSPNTADENIIKLMYERINQVVKDLSTIGNEYDERLSDDILGEIVEMTDVKKILDDAISSSIDRSKSRIDEALVLAKNALSKQQELFEHVASFDPTVLQKEFVPTKQHIYSFVEGMFDFLGIEVIEKTHKQNVWQIRLPEYVQEDLKTNKSRRALTLDRIVSRNREGIEVLDMDHFLMRYLLKQAKSYEFGGHTAVINSKKLGDVTLASAYLRWQNETGKRQRQEYVTWLVNESGQVKFKPVELQELTVNKLTGGTYKSNRDYNDKQIRTLEHAAEQQLSNVSNQWLQPENFELVSAAWLSNE